MSSYLFTSESVSEGHPDKIADQISDAVLDAILAQDKRARVACETMVKTGAAIVAGEVTTSAWVDIESLARNVINAIGYDNSNVGFDGQAVGRRNGNKINFTLAEEQIDRGGNQIRVGAAIELADGTVIIDFEVEFNNSGDVLTAKVPFSKS